MVTGSALGGHGVKWITCWIWPPQALVWEGSLVWWKLTMGNVRRKVKVDSRNKREKKKEKELAKLAAHLSHQAALTVAIWAQPSTVKNCLKRSNTCSERKLKNLSGTLAQRCNLCDGTTWDSCGQVLLGLVLRTPFDQVGGCFKTDWSSVFYCCFIVPVCCKVMLSGLMHLCLIV